MDRKSKYGIFNGIDNEVYHDDIEFLSSSQLKLANKNMNEFHDQVVLGNNKNKGTPSMDLGTMVHCKVLEGDKFFNDYIMFDDDALISEVLKLKPEAKNVRATKEYKTLKKKFEDENTGKKVLSAEDYNKVMAMNNSLMENDLTRPLLEGGVREASIYCNLASQDIRTRPDLLNLGKGVLVDLKTTRDINWFIYDAKKKYDYDLSASLYVDSVKKVFDKDVEFYFVVVQNCEPYTSAVYKLSLETYDTGREKYMSAIHNIKNAKKNSDYRYQKEIGTI